MSAKKKDHGCSFLKNKQTETTGVAVNHATSVV